MYLTDMLGDEIDLTKELMPGQIVGIGFPGNPKPNETQTNQVEMWLSQFPRWFSALLQGARVAHDEMHHYLAALASKYEIAMNTPLLMDTWEETQIQEWKATISSHSMTITAIVVGGHWIPIIVNEGGSKILTTERGESLCTGIFPEATIVVGKPIEVAFSQDCGFQSIAWLIAEITHQDNVSMFSWEQACKWRQLFWHRLCFDPMAGNPQAVILGGHEEALVTAICTLLKEHGVDAANLHERSQALLKKLGPEQVKEALQSNRPWQRLKYYANQSSPPFRLVAPEELEKVLAEKAKLGKAVGNRSNKAPHKSTPSQIHIGPQDIIIPTAVFVQEDGTMMPQLQVRQIGTNARGVIVVTEAEAQPYLTGGAITTEGLALLVLNPSRELQAGVGQLIRFPAQCATTGEPILVSAFLIQKGKQGIQRSMPHKLPKVEEVPVVTVKMLVFRDQVPLKWSEFCESPVKHTMSLAKCLQTCKIPECNCEAWHPESMQDGHTTEAVLDIWNRDFLTHGFKKTPAKEAQMFVFAARVQAEVFSKLTAFSGNEGLYIEPRSSDGRSHDTNFHTVWLPKANHTEAIAAKATSSKQTILVRVQNRYGLKVAMENASQIHEQFRSDTVFLGGQEKVVYTIGPMPWGASRSSLTALFKSWEWQAKPIQAISKSADNRGLVWTVQAMHPPASSVVTMEHGDVLIVRKDPEQEKKIMPPTIEASVRTKQSLQPVFAKDQPLKSDPWADSARRLPGNQMSSVASAQQVAQIEKQVEQRILEKIDKGDEPMSGTLEPRVHALENQIRQLQEAQSHQQKQTTQIAQQVSQVQGQVEQQTHKLQHRMDAKLAEQMTMIEALLNKRSRHE